MRIAEDQDATAQQPYQENGCQPEWYVPRSIILHDMAHHAGNPGYFLARNYYVRDVKTGAEVDLNQVTRAQLVSGAYGVVQRGGKGNALGRIIFRFDNNFSVYLHDTSSKGVFEREERGVSHGCIRIEKPYDLPYSSWQKRTRD